MQQSLPNGCWRGQYSVTPAGWDKAGASCNRHWVIQYYFHDPAYVDDPRFRYGKQCRIKGMNKFQILAERREAVRQLMELEVVALNPVQGIRRMKTVRNKRLELTHGERARIDAHLAEVHPAFRTYVHCFFHLGSRGTEIQRVQGKHVDLVRQRISLLVLKGRQYVRSWRPLKDVALPYWRRALQDGEPEQYVFGVQFLPADAPMRRERPNKVWKRLVKDALGIEANIYSLKHSNSDKTAALAGQATAAEHNAQTSRVIDLYTQGEEERRLERLRKVSNRFA